MDGGRTAASGTPNAVLTPERLRDVWRVDAQLDGGALRVDWLSR